MLSAFDIRSESEGHSSTSQKPLIKADMYTELQIVSNGVCGVLINILNDLLIIRKQKVALNGLEFGLG